MKLSQVGRCGGVGGVVVRYVRSSRISGVSRFTNSYLTSLQNVEAAFALTKNRRQAGKKFPTRRLWNSGRASS
jgi:hypothetical protein